MGEVGTGQREAWTAEELAETLVELLQMGAIEEHPLGPGRYFVTDYGMELLRAKQEDF